MALIYLGMLLLGVLCFGLHYVAQWQISHRLRHFYPQQWAIIAPPDQAPSWLRRWIRMTMVLKTTVPPLHQLLQDARIRRWQRCWSVTPIVAWLAWIAALLLRWALLR